MAEQDSSPERREARAQARRAPLPPWWMLAGLLAVVWPIRLGDPVGGLSAAPAPWWLVPTALHLPYLLILAFLAGGLFERVGYFWRGRAPESPGRLPRRAPTVCVQLPMFNEDAVARRVIEATASMEWPRGRLAIQVLDDSTDAATRAMVRDTCGRVQEETGVSCTPLHRTDRTGYKAGALEAGRRRTQAEFLAIFDADFVPPPDFLLRAIPHFYRADGTPDPELALVQAQWGHLNDDESFLTRAQALWLDDHHTLQQSWRSAAVGFVNFTGTAGVWRASAIEAVGGWRSASLVEDCELSFRILFAGYRTRFIKEIVVPAELPSTFAAYRLQQRRWTKGWAQLQRLHLGTLLFRYRTPWWRKAYLLYHMCISWQWPAWAAWITILPFLILSGNWLGALGTDVGLLLYVAPTLACTLLAGVLATVETKHTYADGPRSGARGTFRRLGRLFPYFVVNAGMLTHHLSAFVEGLLGPLDGEFERTPKAATVTAAARGPAGRPPARPRLRAGGATIRAPYLATEAAYVVSQLAWAFHFVADGLVLAALGSGWLSACIAGSGLASYLPGVVARGASPPRAPEAGADPRSG